MIEQVEEGVQVAFSVVVTSCTVNLYALLGMTSSKPLYGPCKLLVVIVSNTSKRSVPYKNGLCFQ